MMHAVDQGDRGTPRSNRTVRGHLQHRGARVTTDEDSPSLAVSDGGDRG